MDHLEAVRSNAAERYTLGDLPVGQVEEFERHFFECPQCSEELRMLTILAENARAVFTEDSFRVAPEPVAQAPAVEVKPATVNVPKARPWWKQPFLIPAFAALVVAIFTGAQDLQMRKQLNQIGQVSEFPLYAASKGTGNVVSPHTNEAFYLVYFDASWDGEAEHAVLQQESGNGETHTFELAQHGTGTVDVRIPVHLLESGRYVLSILGKTASGAEGELARYPFTLRIE